MNYKRWDIVLAKHPFTAVKTTRKRPALILSTHQVKNRNYAIIMMITSNTKQRNYCDYTIKNWKEAGLLKPSTIKMRFATIDTNIIYKKIGELQKKDIEFLKDIIANFIAH